MGILDDFQFDPTSYGGAPSGWLGALLQPPSGPGFAQDQALAAPNFADMSGGVAFPLAADGLGKGPGTLLPSAADGSGKDQGASNPFTDFLASLGSGIGNALLPSAAAARAGPQGVQAVPSLLDRLSAGATNLTTGGNPIAGVVNSVRGLATGQRTDGAGVRQANQTATFNALVGAGISPQIAQVAALNPEILKTIAAAHAGTPSLPNIGPRPGNPAAPPAASTVSRADLEAEARRRGLIP